MDVKGTARRVVLKIGGSLDGAVATEFAAALRSLMDTGVSLVIVHGGGPSITRALALHQLSMPFVEGLRVTTDEAIDVVVRALNACNEDIQSVLDKASLPVVSLVDGYLFGARDIGLERTGDVEWVDVRKVVEVCGSGGIALVPPYGRDHQGRLYNLNADTAAAALAGALGATQLIFLTDVAGVYADYARGERLLDTTADTLRDLLQQGRFTTGMRPKVEAILSATSLGVRDIWVVDGRDGASLRCALGIERRTSDYRRGTRVQTLGQGV